MNLQITSLNDLRGLLTSRDWHNIQGPANTWAAGHVFEHCAQSIRFSLVGYPINKPKWFQKTIGVIVSRRFLKTRMMTHNKTSAIPGAPALTASVSEGLFQLIAAIDEFQKFQGQLKPHFAFGDLTKQEYESIHLYHIIDHLREWN